MSTFTSVFIVVVVVAVVGAVERFSRRLDRVVKELEKRDQQQLEKRDQQQGEEEDIAFFKLPAPDEYGWDNICVTPAKRRCERVFCFGGPPTYFEIFEYDLRPQDRPSAVFVRLVEMWKEDLSGDSYQVVNGTICACEDQRHPSDNLEKRIVWHEVLGSERYAILAAHGRSKEFFLKEQERIRSAIKQLNARAEALGAVQVGTLLGTIRYGPRPDADEEQKSAIEAGIAALRSEESLRQLDVSFEEVYRQDCAFLLDKLVGETGGPPPSEPMN